MNLGPQQALCTPYASASACLPIARATSARMVCTPTALDSRPVPGPQGGGTQPSRRSGTGVGLCHVLDHLWNSFGPILREIKPAHCLGETQVGVDTGNDNACVSLVGIELLTIDARIVIASVDTYLRFAEAVNRLDLTETESDLMETIMG